jgi:serine/threonine protein kinase
VHVCWWLQEVLGLEFVAPACDIWHFGCMMFELATGKGLLDQFDYHGIMDLIPKAARQYYGDDDCYLLEMTSVFGRLPKNVSRSRHECLSIPCHWWLVVLLMGTIIQGHCQECIHTHCNHSAPSFCPQGNLFIKRAT